MLFQRIQQNGLLANDVRVKAIIDKLKENTEMSFPNFQELLNSSLLLERCLKKHLIIPDFATFKQGVAGCYDQAISNRGGGVATYIPSLAKVPEDYWGVACCSVDGQQFSLGDSAVPFCVQSSSKPLTYAMALELNGEKVVHDHVGREPSGRNFNSRVMLATDTTEDSHGNAVSKGIPHNPCINAGAIMVASLVKPELSEADRFDYVIRVWEKLSGGAPVGFQNSTYLGERATADRNFCLGYVNLTDGLQSSSVVCFIRCLISYCAIQKPLVDKY